MEPMTDAQVQAMLAEHQAVCRRVQAANVDLVERLQTLDGTAYYDPAEDWFLLSIGEPARGVVLEMADEWHWRVDPDSWQILGLEIPNVAAFERAHPPVAARIRALVRLA